ncbi:MAG: YeeE/YedE thiosulfate transporter family protein [Methylococcales bacterium]|nr:YeeE/YedE thiosulfate transporter family protein [Methylococcales bacterium]
MTWFSWPALMGGALIGLAVLLLLVFNQRTAGISGIAAGLTHGSTYERAWRLAFLAGLIGAPAIYQMFAPIPSQFDASISQWLIGGFLVGFGTRLGNGCTSGHGVCGIARGAKRSLAATAVFMLTAICTVWLTRHVL